jgi:hypothetical protein
MPESITVPVPLRPNIAVPTVAVPQHCYTERGGLVVKSHMAHNTVTVTLLFVP